MSLIKLNNRAVKDVTQFGSISSLGSMIFIKKLTASASATLSFVDGTDGVVLDDTYKEYVFTFKDIHPATDGSDFEFNMSTDSGSNYNVTKTTTLFDPIHGEDGSNAGIAYSGSRDLAQGTGFQDLMGSVGSDNDQSGSGYLHLFNPSSDIFVKHFIARTHYSHSGNYALSMFIAGYGNTSSSIDAIRFAMSSGNIDAGDICLYGIA
jgi:hypothetical protein